MKRNIEFDESEWFGVGYTICSLYVLVKAGRFIHISLSLLHNNEFFIDIDVSFCTKIKKNTQVLGLGLLEFTWSIQVKWTYIDRSSGNYTCTDSGIYSKTQNNMNLQPGAGQLFFQISCQFIMIKTLMQYWPKTATTRRSTDYEINFPPFKFYSLRLLTVLISSTPW